MNAAATTLTSATRFMARSSLDRAFCKQIASFAVASGPSVDESNNTPWQGAEP
jgi:hypothetical protein